MDPLDNPLSTHPIQMGREFSIELYPNGQLGCIDNLDHQIGASLVATQTPTPSNGPEPLQTQTMPTHQLKLHIILIWLSAGTS